MSGRECGYIQGSELSVSVARRAAGVGGDAKAPPSSAPLARRARRTDAASSEACWSPVAASMGGEIVPLDDVLSRLAAVLER